MMDIDAPITDVTVYADRALVTRRGTCSLAAGEHALRINNLPHFLRDSLRAAGKGPQGTRILDIDVTTAFYSQPPETELRALHNELDTLQQHIQLLKARQDSLQDRRQWLRTLGEQSKDFAKGIAQGQMKPQDCADFFSFMATQTLQDAEAAQQLELEVKHVQQEIAAKRRELTQKEGRAHPDRQAAVITVLLTEAGDLHLELSYLVMDASWEPQYDVRVQMHEEQNKGDVELTYIGIVQQATGEPWENVKLALSTARPSLASVLPELQPWYLTTYTAPPMMLAAAAPAKAPGASAKQSLLRRERGISSDMPSPEGATDFEQASHEAIAVDAILDTASVEQTGTALVFHIDRSIDIPSDNSPHKTTIGRDHLPCEFDYVSAPAIEQHAHLRATITNATDRTLLIGDASIFLRGEYVGTTKLKLTAPNETFKIFLGIDDAIKVKRELIEQTVDKGNILQNDIRRSAYGYRITVHNYAPNLRHVVVRDHLPVSQHERIKVKMQSIQPQPTKRTKLELLTWKFSLPANGEQKIEYRFVVEHPQDLSVIGLPRT